MPKKRLIGIVTVKDGWAVQSVGFNRYLPLGKPECLVQNLDRWGADEIVVQLIDRSVESKCPDYVLLSKLARLAISTPIVYGGGIRSVSEAVEVVHAGADRVMVDSLLRENPKEVIAISEILGAQAVIASIPASLSGSQLEFYDYRQRASVKCSEILTKIMDSDLVSEVLLQDWKHEGSPAAFDHRIVNHFPWPKLPLIVFGGLSDKASIAKALALPRVAAVAVGNFLNYKEHAIQKFREDLLGQNVRPAIFRHEGLI